MHQYSLKSLWPGSPGFVHGLATPAVSLAPSSPSGEVIPEKSIFPQLQNVQTVTGKRKKLNGLLIVNSLVFERGARP